MRAFHRFWLILLLAVLAAGCGGGGGGGSTPVMPGTGTGPTLTTGTLQVQIVLNQPSNVASVVLHIVNASTGVDVQSPTTIKTGNQTAVSATLTTPLNVALVIQAVGLSSSGQTLTTAASQTLTLSAASPSQSLTLSLAPSIPTALAFVEQPAGAVIDAPLTPVSVQVLDQNGLPVPGDNTTQITLALTQYRAVLGGTTEQTTTDSTATFTNLTVSASGTFTLTATSGALLPASSTSFNITATVGPATHLVFTQQPPATAVAGAVLAPSVQVAVEDVNDVVVPQSNVTVVLKIQANPGAGSLRGTASQVTVNGVATFSDLGISLPGSGYTLQATSGSLTAALSTSINVTNAPGALTLVAGSPFTTGVLTSINFGVAVDPTGPFVYTTTATSNGLGGVISGFVITAGTGALTPIAGSPFTTGASPADLAIDPTGQFVYVTNTGDHTISAFTIIPGSGSLTPVPGSPFAADSQSPDRIVADPNGKFVFVANGVSNTVTAFAINAGTGALTEVAGSPFAAGSPGGQAADIAVDPSGQFLYVSTFGVNQIFSISAFAIGSKTGALSPLAGSPFTTQDTPQNLGMDPGGRFLYATNFSSNTISAYTIAAGTGSLSSVPGSPFAIDSTADAVVVDPTGQFVYVADAAGTEAFTISPATGALTAIPGSPFAGGNGTAVDPSGKFLYGPARIPVGNNAADSGLSAFTIAP